MSRPARAVLLAVVAILAVFQLPSVTVDTADAAGSDASLCAQLIELPGVGPVCPRGPGRYEVYGTSGESLGFVHGADPAPCEGCEEPVSVLSGTTPFCVSAAPNTYYVHVVYARASNDADRYATIVPTIRQLVADANAYVSAAGVATGTDMDIRVLCNNGVVTVENLVLPTSMASDSFSTIVSDIRALGHNDPKQKYWVWYDDNASNPACGCSGTGHIYMDETAAATNLNNGNAANAMFAVNFGYVSVNTWLHELGHNLGAVQDSAPFSSQAGHCIDGIDIMCYNDGGPNSSGYSNSYCATRVFDCNKNTYCHANPAAGSWLATHWNVCGSAQRFLQRAGTNAPPTMQSLSCTPVNPSEGATVTCSFRAADPGNNLTYNISWGDGTATVRVPTSGYVASNVTQSSTHVFNAGGTYVVSVTATDDRSPPLTSAAFTQTMVVNEVNTAPVVQSLACTSTTLQPGATATCSFNATDDNTGVRFTVDWGDGQTTSVPSSTGWVAPGATLRSATHAYASVGNFTVSVTATDNATSPLTSAARTATIRVANNAPVMQTLSCTAATIFVGDTASCTFNATDDSSGVRYRIAWGDGQITDVPSTGHVAPGPVRSASHVYTAAGNFTVQVTATDNVTPALTSAARTASVRVTTDTTPPSLTLAEPASGYLYVGCGVKEAKQSSGILFVQRGCVKALATDASGIARVEVRSGGQVLATATTLTGPHYVLEFLVEETALGKGYEVRAYDRFNNLRVVTFLADGVSTSTS